MKARKNAKIAAIGAQSVVVMLMVYFVLHLCIALLSAHFDLADLARHLTHLDSTWYSHIATHGYTHATELPDPPLAVFAFFPLWPVTLHAIQAILPQSWPIQVDGTIASASLFASLIFFISRSRYMFGLRPASILGGWCFLFNPGAWVFASNHTEALFLVLSWSSLSLACRGGGRRTLITASALAGLAALTRNQGVMVAIATACALAFASERKATVADRLGLFALSGIISGSLYALWPAFQWYASGNPLVSASVQANWHMVDDFDDYLSSMLWISSTNAFRAGIFWVCLAVGLALLRRAKSWPLGVYVILSILLWPLQGNSFPQAYRFGAVLFPVWFCLGDGAESLIARYLAPTRPRLAQLAKGLIMIGFFAWSGAVSYNYYFRSEVFWPY